MSKRNKKKRKKRQARAHGAVPTGHRAPVDDRDAPRSTSFFSPFKKTDFRWWTAIKGGRRPK